MTGKWTLVLVFVAGLAWAEAPVQSPDSPGVPGTVNEDFVSAALAPEAAVVPPGAILLDSDHPRIDRAMAYYLGAGRPWVEKSLARAKPYRDFIRSRLEAEGLPPEIFWLAAVESGFNSAATSRVGAAGMWQFMRNSIGGYGMQITPYVDERRDWWKATEGAIRKLKDNYQRLGDWYLALAAYNAGLGKIQGILKRSGGDRDYWSLLDRGLLPKETAGYIPQLIALARISEGWDRYGFTVDWEPSPDWERVRVEKMVDLRLLAEAAGVPVDGLRGANTELVYHLTPQLAGGYDLKVHPDWVEPLNQALADPSVKLIKYYLYTVRKGDTLSEIAQWYGVSVSMIERDNPGLRPALLKIGQNLVIAALRDVGPYPGSRRG